MRNPVIDRICVEFEGKKKVPASGNESLSVQATQSAVSYTHLDVYKRQQEYHIDLGFPLDGKAEKLLPLARPFSPPTPLGEQLGISAAEVMARLTHMLERGIIRRIGVVPNHYEMCIRDRGIDRDQNAGIEAVCVAGQPFDIGNRVAGIYARAKSRAADIHGIGAMADRFNTEFGVLGRGQEFQSVANVWHGVVWQQRLAL